MIFVSVNQRVERFEIDLDSQKKEVKKRNYKAIIKNKWFLLFALAYVFIGYLTLTSDSFISLVFTKVKGLSSGEYSLIHAGAILTEVLTIYALGRLKKNVNLNKLFLIAGIILFLRHYYLREQRATRATREAPRLSRLSL